MSKLRVAPLAAAVAAALMGTTGYCVLTNTGSGLPPTPPQYMAPVRLLPEAIESFPLVDPAPADALD